MKNLLFKLFAFAMVLLFANACNDSMIPDDANEDIALKSASNVKQSYIIVLQDADLETELSKLNGYEKKQAAVKSASAKILKRAGILDGDVEHVYGSALKGFSVKIPPGQLKKLQDDPAVKYIEKDRIVTLAPPPGKGKPGGGDSGGGGTSSQTVPWGITRVNGAVNATGKTAWIIDSGIDLDHPDLNVDRSKSVDYTGSRKGAEDENGHGTHVAGTIAAIDNNIGVVGVAAGATVVAVRVLDRRGSGSYSGVIAGVDYVGANGSNDDVANMSLGGPASDALDQAVENAAQFSGVKFVLAAGNESDDANNHSPARANGPNVYTVSAMDINDNWAYFSNYGNPPVDYCAPGYSIYSTYKNGGYETLSGTSMAAPHVAGILLLGNISSDGTVNGDPDGDADYIAVH